MKQLLLLFFSLCSLNIVAQDFTQVKWTFRLEKDDPNHRYILHATANVEMDWHVFAPNPGGDGLLIPTELVLENVKGIKNIGTFTPERRPITKEMAGIGMVNYYEGEIGFTLTFEADRINAVKGTVSFQCCNDKMCLPPRNIPFTAKL